MRRLLSYRRKSNTGPERKYNHDRLRGMPRKPEQPLIAPLASLKSSSSSGISALGEDLIQKGARRVGFIGLIAALTAPAAFLTERALQPERVLASGPAPLPAL